MFCGIFFLSFKRNVESLICSASSPKRWVALLHQPFWPRHWFRHCSASYEGVFRSKTFVTDAQCKLIDYFADELADSRNGFARVAELLLWRVDATGAARLLRSPANWIHHFRCWLEHAEYPFTQCSAAAFLARSNANFLQLRLLRSHLIA